MEEQFSLSPKWWGTPYLFNGKELDSRTNLYYYGARYYDPGISGWLSVDPLAEKYAGWSSYAFTMNNPINLIDPDGRGVKGKDDIIVEGQVWTPGAQWDGDENDFGAKTFSALNSLYETIQAGDVKTKEKNGNVIMDFVGSDVDVEIIYAGENNGSKASESGSQIFWDPDDDIMIGPSEDGKNVPGILSSTTQLAHEFGHAWLAKFAPSYNDMLENSNYFDAEHHSFILPKVEANFSRARGEGVRFSYRSIHPNKEEYLKNTGLTGFGDYFLNRK